MKKINTFTKDKTMFINLLTSTNMDCAITDEYELLIWDTRGDKPWECAHDSKPKLITEFSLAFGPDVVILNEFMAEHYPKIDVDVEFETHRPGVFMRFQEFDEDAYYEFQEYQKQITFESLQEQLNDMGYTLDFEQ